MNQTAVMRLNRMEESPGSAGHDAG